MNEPKTARMDIIGQNGNDGLHYEKEKAFEAKINPTYYSKGISTTDYIESHDLGFFEGQIIKYITRFLHKHDDPLEDLGKARWYLEKLINKHSKE